MRRQLVCRASVHVREETRRAYQRRRNQRRNDDAKRFRQIEARITKIEEESKRKEVVFVLRDRCGDQVPAESVTAVVAPPGLAVASASASGTGELRLKSGSSPSVTTSEADSGNVTELVVGDVCDNAVATSPLPRVDTVSTVSTGVERLKWGSSPSVTSARLSRGSQQQSIGGASRLKSSENLDVMSAADVQFHLRLTRGPKITSGGPPLVAEHRTRSSTGNLSTTRNGSEIDCRVTGSKGKGNEMECDSEEEGEVKVLSDTDVSMKRSRRIIKDLDRENKDLQEKLDTIRRSKTNTFKEVAATKKKNNHEASIAAWNNGGVKVLKNFFPIEIRGKFTRMLSFRRLEKFRLEEISHMDPAFDVNTSKRVDYITYSQCEQKQSFFADWRRFYLSRKPYIDIDDSDRKEESFLSALILLPTFNDTFNKRFLCPCHPFHERWKSKFCFFGDEMKDCFFICSSSKELSDHCKDIGKSCRYHYLSYKFMEKVFNKEIDLSKDFDLKSPW